MSKEAIEEIGKQFGIAIDWTKDNVMPQIMEIMQHYANYRFTVDLVFTIGIGVLILVLIGLMIYGLIDDWDEGVLFLLVIVLLLGLLFAGMLDATIGWKLCPEVMFYEHIKG